MTQQDHVSLDQLKAIIREKPDITDFLTEIAMHPEMIPLLLEIIRTDKGSMKFFCDKVLQNISENNPMLLYPYFADIAANLDSPNNFIKWGAIITLGNLVAVDREDKFTAISDKYLGLIDDESMITAGNAAKAASRIVQQRPDSEPGITARLLRVVDNTYFYKGEPSPECKNIMIGHVLDCFDGYFEHSASQNLMLEFARGQTENTRTSVAKKAGLFLKKHQG